MILRIPTTTADRILAVAASCGIDPSEVARRALRRAARIGVLRSTNRVRVTRGGSRVVRLDVDDIAPGARPAEVRAALWSVMGSVETAPAPAIEAEAGAYVVVSMEDA